MRFPSRPRFPFWFQAPPSHRNGFDRRVMRDLGREGHPDPTVMLLFGNLHEARRSFYKSLLTRWLPLMLWRCLRDFQSPLEALRGLHEDFKHWSLASRKAEYHMFLVLENPLGLNASTYATSCITEETQEEYRMGVKEFEKIGQALMARVRSPGRTEKFRLESFRVRNGTTWRDVMVTRAMNHKNDMWAIHWRLDRKYSRAHESRGTCVE